MQQKVVLKLSPVDADDEAFILQQIASSAGIKKTAVSGFSILKKSIDARGKNIYINLIVNAFINEPVTSPQGKIFPFKNVANAAKKVIIIGSGPAGIFAALQLLQDGIKPIILERGKDVRARRRDLAKLNKEGIVNPESNYCFGEGGAGTYSDGKLYTRSNKRGDIDKILDLFIYFGAPTNIAYDAHPHIGTNKLPQIVAAMHNQIRLCGGEVLFEKKVIDILIADSKIASVKTADGDTFSGDAYVLATGHSARDVFTLLHSKNILIEPKPFAMGVRIEHPQSLIDSIQYHCGVDRDVHLPPAAYSLVRQVNGRGVFSFCMCPGGIVAPAATDEGELVVNGWSPSKRNNAFANSGIVVQVEKTDALACLLHAGVETNENDPLIFMKFQQMVEGQTYKAGGGNFKAPAQRMQDFVKRKLSETLPLNSYLPGLTSSKLDSVLPAFIYDALAESFQHFGKKMKGYYTNEAVIIAIESRTSSPVRIPRDAENLQHPELNNLYPCGEGAGYAGGIVSAAMDGERVANMIAGTT
ncbi:MAG: NAD(P)/FAD-dependent oxidoreductase [Ferruginibacter sp.]